MNIKNILKSVAFKFKGRLTVYSFLTILLAALNIFTPYVLIFSLSPTTSIPELWIVGGYGLAWGMSRAIPALRNKLLLPINENFSNSLSEKIANRFYSLPLDYQLSAPTGQVSLLITKSYYSVIKLIPSSLGNIMPTIVEAIAATSILTFLYGPIGLSQIGILIVYAGSSVLNARWITVAQKEELDQGFAFAGHYQSAFNNYENAHYFGNVNYELSNFNRQASLFSTAMNRTSNLIENASLRQVIILGIGFAGTMLFATWELTQKNLSLSDFFMISLYSSQFALMLNNFSPAINDFRGAVADLKKIVEFFNEGPGVSENINFPHLSVQKNNASLRFENISFSYKDRVILNNVSFNIEPGQKIAIVGLSGEGKSTILKLLFRFYEATLGDIFINGQNIKEVTLSSLRAAVAVVPQNPTLFNNTILENIRYGNMKSSEKLVEQAATYAGLADFISKNPEGIHTIVGEQGSKISGGQRQRIAIARAVIKQSPILVLDEATSSLDISTEREVQENLDYISSGCTTLIVTHRLTTVINADNIIYLKNGKIHEQGTYEELMELKGLFYQQMVEHCESLGFRIEDLRAPSKKINNLTFTFGQDSVQEYDGSDEDEQPTASSSYAPYYSSKVSPSVEESGEDLRQPLLGDKRKSSSCVIF